MFSCGNPFPSWVFLTHQRLLKTSFCAIAYIAMTGNKIQKIVRLIFKAGAFACFDFSFFPAGPVLRAWNRLLTKIIKLTEFDDSEKMERKRKRLKERKYNGQVDDKRALPLLFYFLFFAPFSPFRVMGSCSNYRKLPLMHQSIETPAPRPPGHSGR